MPRVRGSKTITAMLPNGRTAWLRISPPPASAFEINRLRVAITSADRRVAARQRKASRAIAKLTKKLTASTKKIGRRQLAAQRKLEKRRIKGDAKLRKKLAVRSVRARLAHDRRKDKELLTLKRLRRRQIWDQIVLTSSAPLFAAYGQRSEPFGEHNLVLTLSLAVWLLGDEITDTITRGRRRRGLASMDAWSYIAPVGNVLTGWWLLNDRQHERFATGISDSAPSVFSVVDPPDEMVGVGDPPGPPGPDDGGGDGGDGGGDGPPVDGPTDIVSPDVNPGGDDPGGDDPDDGGEVVVVDEVVPMATYAFVVAVDLEPHVAEGHIDDLRGFSTVPAVAVLTNDEWTRAAAEAGFTVGNLSATVSGGVLTMSIEARAPANLETSGLPAPRIAWMVDVKPNDNQ